MKGRFKGFSSGWGCVCSQWEVDFGASGTGVAAKSGQVLFWGACGKGWRPPAMSGSSVGICHQLRECKQQPANPAPDPHQGEGQPWLPCDFQGRRS